MNYSPLVPRFDFSADGILSHKKNQVRIESVTWFCLLIWMGGSATGFGIWQEFEATPGPAVQTLGLNCRTPADGQSRLLVYLHPRCPCSGATLEELARVLEQAPPEVAVEIVFVRPPGTNEGWERGDLWNRAAELPRVQVRVDRDGKEAESVGAATSGFVVLHDSSGRTQFQGGITRGRGMLGGSAGARSLIAVLRGREVPEPAAAVFGCPLSDQCPRAGIGGGMP
jgi:hypothetical protein